MLILIAKKDTYSILQSYIATPLNVGLKDMMDSTKSSIFEWDKTNIFQVSYKNIINWIEKLYLNFKTIRTSILISGNLCFYDCGRKSKHIGNWCHWCDSLPKKYVIGESWSLKLINDILVLLKINYDSNIINNKRLCY